MSEAIVIGLLMVAIVGMVVAGYVLGYHAARESLTAATTVLEAANAVSQQTSWTLEATVDYKQLGAETKERLTALEAEMKRNTETLNARHKDVTDAVYTLLEGLHQAGVARRSTRPGRQVGEATDHPREESDS